MFYRINCTSGSRRTLRCTGAEYTVFYRRNCTSRTLGRPQDSPRAQVQNIRILWRKLHSSYLQLNWTGFVNGRKINVFLLRENNCDSSNLQLNWTGFVSGMKIVVFLLRENNCDSPNLQLNWTGFVSGMKIMVFQLRENNGNRPRDSPNLQLN